MADLRSAALEVKLGAGLRLVQARPYASERSGIYDFGSSKGAGNCGIHVSHYNNQVRLSFQKYLFIGYHHLSGLFRMGAATHT
ncbi:unnamed protein product, partial [marine sediment metagenome]